MRRDRSRPERCGARMRRGKLEVFLDRQMFVEGVVLRNVGDVLA